jgi:hypothetical protein
MANFKPQIIGYNRKNQYDEPNPIITTATYVLAKKKVKELLEDYDEVSVSRSRRGEWGEWFEKWQNVNGVPTIIKQGWM